MIIDAVGDDRVIGAKPNAAERLVSIARSAGTHDEAVAAVERALEDLLK
jgi:hypothetical protein